jgi:hypothetical protein
MKMNRGSSLIAGAAPIACAALGHAVPVAAARRYFPSGPIHAYRRRYLQLALESTEALYFPYPVCFRWPAPPPAPHASGHR